MVVSIHESFRKAMPAGNGIGYELRKRAGGTDTEIVSFGGGGNIGAGVTRDHPGLAFATGDQLFWRIDTWGMPAVTSPVQPSRSPNWQTLR
jgi:hypothetical protein